MYRDDDRARADRANALIDEIGELERQKVAQVATEQRLEAARRELSTLQVRESEPEPPRPAKPPGLGTHLLVFGASAAAAYAGYALLF